MTILLGTYGIKSIPFCLYTYNSNHYFCLQDMNALFSTNQNQVQDIFKANSIDFIKNKHTGRIFIMTRTVILIARIWGCYYLAELCKLTLDEILGKVAEPLLNMIQHDNWQCASHHTVIVERNLAFEPVEYSDFIRSHSPSLNVKSIHVACPPMNNMFYQWLCFDINYKHLSTIKKQQQAIIETRQRQIAFHTSAVNLNSKKKPHKLKQNIAGTIQKRTLPPSPPPHPLKRKRTKKQEAYNKYILEHGNDNLNLLATQATQMRGLPISPEVSPSPPPPLIYQQRQRLPSLQTMLSELKPI